MIASPVRKPARVTWSDEDLTELATETIVEADDD